MARSNSSTTAEASAANGRRPKKNDAAPERGSLFRLGDHFDGVDQRVVYDRLELQQDVALFVGRDAGESLFQGAVGSASFFKDVEVFQQRFAITEDVKNAAARPAVQRICRAEVPLCESERNSVASGRHRDGV